MADYQVVVVSKNGTRYAELENAEVQEVHWELNAPGAVRFSLPVTDAKATEVYGKEIEREIQIWRNGTLLSFGPIVRTAADSHMIQVQAAQNPLWFLGRRYFGKADRANALLNPEFESNLTSWTAVGATATADTTRRITGTKSAKLVSAAAGADNFLRQQVTVTGTGVGSLYTLVAWFWLNSAGFVGGALDDRGLYIERVGQGQVEFVPIDEFTPKDAWERVEVEIWVPPNAIETLDVRLYSPGGTIFVDAANLVLMESVSYYATDQAAIAAGIVTHAQDTAFAKSSLNLATSAPATGVTRDRHYQFAEHQRILEALREFSDLSDGFDFSVALTATTRTFTTHYPERGSLRSALVLEFGRNIAEFRISFDGEAANSSVTVLGAGDGPDREEGAATDSAVFGGTIVEDVVAAPQGTAIDALDAFAVEQLAVTKNPRILEVTTHEGPVDLIGVLSEGDTVPVRIDHGAVQISANYRVVAMYLNPDTDTLRLTLNAA